MIEEIITEREDDFTISIRRTIHSIFKQVGIHDYLITKPKHNLVLTGDFGVDLVLVFKLVNELLKQYRAVYSMSAERNLGKGSLSHYHAYELNLLDVALMNLTSRDIPQLRTLGRVTPVTLPHHGSVINHNSTLLVNEYDGNLYTLGNNLATADFTTSVAATLHLESYRMFGFRPSFPDVVTHELEYTPVLDGMVPYSALVLQSPDMMRALIAGFASFVKSTVKLVSTGTTVRILAEQIKKFGSDVSSPDIVSLVAASTSGNATKCIEQLIVANFFAGVGKLDDNNYIVRRTDYSVSKIFDIMCIWVVLQRSLFSPAAIMNMRNYFILYCMNDFIHNYNIEIDVVEAYDLDVPDAILNFIDTFKIGGVAWDDDNTFVGYGVLDEEIDQNFGMPVGQRPRLYVSAAEVEIVMGQLTALKDATPYLPFLGKMILSVAAALRQMSVLTDRVWEQGSITLSSYPLTFPSFRNGVIDLVRLDFPVHGAITLISQFDSSMFHFQVVSFTSFHEVWLKALHCSTLLRKMYCLVSSLEMMIVVNNYDRLDVRAAKILTDSNILNADEARIAQECGYDTLNRVLNAMDDYDGLIKLEYRLFVDYVLRLLNERPAVFGMVSRLMIMDPIRALNVDNGVFYFNNVLDLDDTEVFYDEHGYYAASELLSRRRNYSGNILLTGLFSVSAPQDYPDDVQTKFTCFEDIQDRKLIKVPSCYRLKVTAKKQWDFITKCQYVFPLDHTLSIVDLSEWHDDVDEGWRVLRMGSVLGSLAEVNVVSYVDISFSFKLYFSL